MDKMRFVSFAVLFLLILCSGCSSSSDLPGTEHKGPTGQGTVLTESMIAKIVNRHSAIYKEVLHSAIEEQKRDSVTGVQNAVDYFMKSYPAEDRPFVKHDWRINKDEFGLSGKVPSIEVMPVSLKEELEKAILDSDYSPIAFFEESIKPTVWYASLNKSLQQEVYIDLCLIGEIRQIILDEALGTHSRMSPGDRMIWRESMKSLTPEQRKKVIQALLGGLGVVASPVIGLSLTIIGLWI